MLDRNPCPDNKLDTMTRGFRVSDRPGNRSRGAIPGAAGGISPGIPPLGTLSRAFGADFEFATRAFFKPALVRALGSGSTGAAGTRRTADPATDLGIPLRAVIRVRLPVRQNVRCPSTWMRQIRGRTPHSCLAGDACSPGALAGRPVRLIPARQSGRFFELLHEAQSEESSRSALGAGTGCSTSDSVGHAFGVTIGG